MKDDHFNTGHGFRKFNQGVKVSNQSWYNIIEQDILATW